MTVATVPCARGVKMSVANKKKTKTLFLSPPHKGQW